MAEYEDSYYARTLAESRQRPSLQENIRTETCVIGGGLAGLATALSLAERGGKVVVLEGNRIGWGASGRNGGQVLTGYAASIAKMVRRAGREGMKELYGLTRESLELVRTRIAQYGIACDPVDGVMLASWYDDESGLRKEMDFETQELGLRVEFVPRDKLRDLYRTSQYYDGLFYPDYFHIHPLNYTRGLADAAESRGAAIYEETMALGVRREKTGFTVKTAHGSVRADNVVYCVSAYSNGIEKRLQWASLPVSAFVAVTEDIGEEKLQSAVNAPYAVCDTRWDLDFYRKLPGTNRILWGGGVGIGNYDMPDDLEQRMLAKILNVYPQLEGIKIESVWTGAMSSTVHRMPHIGTLAPGLWFCTNFGNNGIGPTAAGGEIVASAIAGGDDRYRLFAPFGLEYAGGFLGPYVAQGIYRYWQLCDKYRQWKHDRLH